METQLLSLGASLGIGLAALGVAIGQAFFINKIMGILGRNPKMTPFFLTLAILGIALVESSAIYGLIVAMQSLSADFVNPLASIGVGLSIGLTGLGVGIGEGIIVEEASKAINKNSDDKNRIMSFMILFIALVESAAIYGIIISFKILEVKEISTIASIGAGLSIGLAGLGVAIGEGMIARKAIGAFGNPQNQDSKIVVPFAILGIALVEAAAIYALVISLQILDPKLFVKGVLTVGAGLAVGLAGLGVAIGQGMLVSNSLSKIGTPGVEAKGLIPVTVLGVALVESAAIYGLVIAFQLLSKDITIGLNAIGAGLTIGLTGLGAGLGQGYVGYKAMDAIAINKDLKNRIITYLVLFIALIESVAIYGLVLSMNIIGKTSEISFSTVGIALAIGLSGIGVAIGASLLTGKVLTLVSRRPEMSGFFITIAVLGVALVESAAIYGLIVSFGILGKETISGIIAFSAGLSIGLTGLGVGIAEGYIISGSASSMARNPENKTKYLTFMILFVALVEVLAIYGLIIANGILNK